MLKIRLACFALLLLLFADISPGSDAAQSKQKISASPAGTLQKMVVQNGSVTLDLDLNSLNGTDSSAAAGVPPANSSHSQPIRLPLQLVRVPASNVVIHRKLVRMRAKTRRVVFFLFHVDPIGDEVFVEDVAA